MLGRLALAFVLLPGAALAADATVAADGTVEQDIQCAAWSAYMISASDNSEVKTAMGYTMTYFIGLYEGKSGKPFAAAMLEVAEAMENDADFRKAVGTACLPRMQDISDRMSNLGK